MVDAEKALMDEWLAIGRKTVANNWLVLVLALGAYLILPSLLVDKVDPDTLRFLTLGIVGFYFWKNWN